MTHTIEQIRSGELAGIRRLNLKAGLTAFPPEIYDLAATLEILDLSGNALSSLPDDLPRLHKLKIIFCSDNLFSELPEVLGQCPHLTQVGFRANQIRTVPAKALPPKLRWLTLTDNRLEALPPEIGDCPDLQKLMLSGNNLSELPETLLRCQKLELLRIAANRFERFPEGLLTLPRLSWLAYAGNPFCADVEAQKLNNGLKDAPVSGIRWADLELQHVLGEGASGVIHRAVYQSGTGPCDVAVKVFKGAMTSDGLPDREMAACLSAGLHPNLIPVLGQVADHPEGRHVLVMDLVDPAFANLAGPPSLESCTRDIYSPDAFFDLASVLRIAQGMASVARHLHDRGLMHGDFYAHNILYDRQGHALLGDFGGASFCPDPALAEALQRLEVRAFGYLLEELLERCTASGDEAAIFERLSALKAACLSEIAGERPLFAEIESVLKLAIR
jgi:hypothetical protein